MSRSLVPSGRLQPV